MIAMRNAVLTLIGLSALCKCPLAWASGEGRLVGELRSQQSVREINELATPPGDRVIAIVEADVIDGRGGAPLRDATVVVARGRMGAEGRAFPFETAAGPSASLMSQEFFVSPTGAAGAAGTLADPLSLEAAISENSPARPGDTIWVLGGIYQGHFTSLVSGTATGPVTLRAMPGQRATIDGSLTIGISKRPEGAFSRVWGLEVTSSLTERVSAEPGSFPTDITIGTGVDVFAPNASVINLVIHDIVGNGIGVWRSATNTQIYGNLVYNNGWRAPDRGHGHGIYSQNEKGVKVIRDNIIFQNLGQGLTAHGSGVQRGWKIEGNAMFRDHLSMGFFDTIHSIHLLSNRIYDGTIRTLLRSGSTDLVLRGNYTTENLQLQVGQDLTCTDNRSRGVKLTVPAAERLSRYQLDGNTYVGGPLGLADSESSTGYTFAQWQALGFDPNGIYVDASAGAEAFVTPNVFERGRGQVTVYNWTLEKTVQADVSSFLEPGDRYEVRDVQNYWGAPVATGTYQGGKIALPMNLTSVAGRNGNLGTPAHTSAEYNAFVVLRTRESGEGSHNANHSGEGQDPNPSGKGSQEPDQSGKPSQSGGGSHF